MRACEYLYFLLPFWFFLVGVSAGRAADPIGLVISLQGSATAANSGGISRPLEVSADIFLHDTVTTHVGSKLQILFNDDSVFAQGENSSMTLEEYLFSPSDPKNNAFGVKLGKGLFRTVTGKITDLNQDRFVVKTSRATIRIRGCDLGFAIKPSEDAISAITIPPGKTIFVEPMQGDQKATLEMPAIVIVDDEGRLESQPLSSDERKLVQEGTTPFTETESVILSEPIDPTDVIPKTITYAFSGQGAAEALIQSDAVDGLGIPYKRNDMITGTTTIDWTLGNGQSTTAVRGELGDVASTHLVFNTGVHPIQPAANIAPLPMESFTLSTGGGSSKWVETDLIFNKTDLTLFYPPNSENLPIAGQLNGIMEASSPVFGDAGISISTEKIPLN